MKKSIGIIGYGNWGKILRLKLSKIPTVDIKFICTSKDDYRDKLGDVEWIFIATPDATHYDIVKECLEAKKNVFCEKPLALTLSGSLDLIQLAEKMNVKLYVDDVFTYREENILVQESLGEKSSYIKTEWAKTYTKPIYKNFNQSLLYRLAYHDLYMLYDKCRVETHIDVIPVTVSSGIGFKLKFNDQSIVEFHYSCQSQHNRHIVNGIKFDNVSTENADGKDALQLMIEDVLSDKVSFYKNHARALFANEIIDRVIYELFPKVAVVGGGIFGTTCAWKLSQNGYQVDLYEKNDSLINQASLINQYRLHRGYHYPRSLVTALSSIEGEKSFIREYRDAIYDEQVKHYYCIASKDSFITADEYLAFLDTMDLEYEQVEPPTVVNDNSVDITIKATEYLFNPHELKRLVQKKLDRFNVRVHLNTEIKGKSTDDHISIDELLFSYDYIVIATYANINNFIDKLDHKDYQYELCEKPVVKLPKEYRNLSVVIMDGPFMCFDPLGPTGYHVMGHVVHAIHETNIGKLPISRLKYADILNRGIIKDPPVTNFNKFIKSAKHFFPNIDQAEHIGSMYTFRTVLPNCEQDDARPTLVEQAGDYTYVVFSGKIGTAVDAAEELLRQIEESV